MAKIRIGDNYLNLWRLATPVIVAQVGQISVQLVDTFMVGRLGGSVPLASVTLANSLVMPVMIVGLGMAMGLTPLVGRANARGDFRRVQSLVKNSISLNTVLGVLLTLLMLSFTFLMPMMGQDKEILPTAIAYNYMMAAGVLPMLWFATARQFLEGLGNTKWAMVITIAGNLMNVGLNAVFIYGYLGAPAMGAVGAGLATLISRIAMAAMFVALLYKRECYRQFFVGLSKIVVSRFRMFRLFKVGGPIAVQLGVEMAAISAMAVAVGTFGADYLAAQQIAINIPSLSFMFVVGISNATTIIVSRNYGLKLYGEIRRTLRAAVVTITVFMICTAAIFLSFAHPIVSVFTTDPTVAAIAANLLFFGAVFQISDGVQGVTLGALRGLLEVMKPMYYAIFTYLIIGVSMAWLFSVPLGIGPGGVWVGFIASLTTLASLYLFQFSRKIRRLEAGDN